jgi:hypothetical protein
VLGHYLAVTTTTHREGHQQLTNEPETTKVSPILLNFLTQSSLVNLISNSNFNAKYNFKLNEI